MQSIEEMPRHLSDQLERTALSSSASASFEMTLAQKDFVARKDPGSDTELSSLCFTTWYHPDDVQRIVWAIDRAIPASEKAAYHKPHVFFDMEPPLFEARMIYCRDALQQSKDKKYFPFIIKPEVGGAHFTAGILRKEDDGCIKLFFFNPLGYEGHEALNTAQKRLKLIDINDIDGMQVICSQDKIQDLDKEGGGIVSCGPISVLFLQYALQHPEWVDSLDEAFRLPECLTSFLHHDQATYQQQLIAVRKRHFDLLENVSDALLISDVNNFYYPFSDKLGDAYELMKSNSYVYQKAETEFDIFLNQSDVVWGHENDDYDAGDAFPVEEAEDPHAAAIDLRVAAEAAAAALRVAESIHVARHVSFSIDKEAAYFVALSRLLALKTQAHPIAFDQPFDNLIKHVRLLKEDDNIRVTDLTDALSNTYLRLTGGLDAISYNNHANTLPGKSSTALKVLAGLMLALGIAAATLCVVFLPVLMSGIAAAVGSLAITGTASLGLFAKSKQTGLAEGMSQISKTVENETFTFNAI